MKTPPDMVEHDFHELTEADIEYIENNDNLVLHEDSRAIESEDGRVWALCWVRLGQWEQDDDTDEEEIVADEDTA